MAVPGLNAKPDDIDHVFSGLLPVTEEGSVTLTDRETIFDHGMFGGPLGLYSLSGVKFTTSRLVAEKTLNIIYPDTKKLGYLKKPYKMPVNNTLDEHGILNIWSDSGPINIKWKNALNALMREEAVLHLDDLMLRRTSLWDNPLRAVEIAPYICQLFDWDDLRVSKELERLKSFRHYRNDTTRELT